MFSSICPGFYCVCENELHHFANRYRIWHMEWWLLHIEDHALSTWEFLNRSVLTNAYIYVCVNHQILLSRIHHPACGSMCSQSFCNMFFQNTCQRHSRVSFKYNCVGIWNISHEISLTWMSQNLIETKPTLAQISQYLNQCSPGSMTPYGVNQGHWVTGTRRYLFQPLKLFPVTDVTHLPLDKMDSFLKTIS